MIRTQIQLDDSVYRVLRQYAGRRHISMAACIRTAIEQFLAGAATQQEDLSDVSGRFQPLPMDELKSHDRTWAEE